MTQMKVRLRVFLFSWNSRPEPRRAPSSCLCSNGSFINLQKASDPFSFHFGSVSFFAEGPYLSEPKGIASVSFESDKTKTSGQPSLERKKYWWDFFFFFTTPDLLSSTKYLRGGWPGFQVYEGEQQFEHWGGWVGLDARVWVQPHGSPSPPAG